MDNIDVEQCALYSGSDLSLRNPAHHLRTADPSSRSSSATRTKDASSRRYLSFDDHLYQQLQPDLKTECHVNQQIETASAEGTRLNPRSFEASNSRYTFWIGSDPFKTTENGGTGNHVDLRYVLPIATVVCVVAVVPLIVFAATHSKMEKIIYEYQYDTYECSVAAKASKDMLSGDLAINLIVLEDISFTAAKVIDLAWSMLVGRGYQAIAAYACYRLFTGILYLTAEQQSISARTYSAVAFYATSLWSSGSIFRTIRLEKLRLFNKLAFVWMLISVMYLLFVVTMADLMTGYVAGQAMWLKYPNGTMMETGPINETALFNIVLDVQNAHLPPQNITMPDKMAIQPNWTLSAGGIHMAVIPSSPESKNGTMIFESCLNVNEMGLYYVDAYLDPRPGNPYGPYWYSSGDYRYNDPPRQKLLISYPAESCLSLFNFGTTDLFQLPNYSPNMVARSEKLPLTKADKRSLQGFSYQYTILLTSINSIWLLVTVSLWLHVELKSQFLQKRGPLGTWRAVIDLANAVQEKLGCDTGAYTEAQLEKEIGKIRPLTYSIEQDAPDGLGRIRLGTSGEGDEEWPRRDLNLDWKVKYC
ncbi:hypothetical protein D6C87_06699 [Aureobasidium pullulans]|uniref:Uncharacterized protein n=1 Tax=Aureobasidium pullulans TaxID=5580 RepID=A0AB38LXX1_AURPU|nr:hypothetical protein D6C94_05405 [Aureobasidium pullulans]THZ40065.1 hypothetical protein D6C87_06699 [Aureobasidium pullulans]